MNDIRVFELIQRKELYEKVLPNVEILMSINQKVCRIIAVDVLVKFWISLLVVLR